MPMVEFVGQSARDADNIAANPSRLINCYREPVVMGGRTGWAIKSVPGLTPLAQLPGLFVRAMTTVEGRLYAAGANGLMEIDAEGDVTVLGTIPDCDCTTMSGNNGVVTVVAGGDYWTWDGTTLTNPAPGAFDDFGAVEFFGDYTILTERNGRRFQWSDQADATDLPGLNFSTADGRDDNILRAFQINGVLYLFKETSHEIWFLTGQAGAAALERTAGGVFDVGLKAFGLICRLPAAAFFVTDDNKAALISGGQVQPVSTPAVETAIQYGEPVACIAYEDEGHTFAAIIFADRPAWVFDLATNEWHERAEGANFGPWSALSSAKFGGKWYAGRADGAVLLFERNNEDGEAPLIREATSRTLYLEGTRFVASQLEMFPRQGFTAGHMTLALSRDGGLTWGDEKPRAIGPVGNYSNRVIWRRLGQFRQLTARVRWADSDDVTLNAEARVVV